MSALDDLKKFTTVVADTGEIDTIAQYQPRDATTNPSLLYKAAQLPDYQSLVDDAIAYGQSKADGEDALIDGIVDKLSVNFGCKILEIIPGRVSTEVDARLSFDRQGTIEKAHELIALYREAGVSPERVLIKIASTWEGIKAAETLEQEGIHCNLTLLFGFGQAIACGEANVTLISPFVGRIYDWYKAKQGVDHIPIEDDPGVQSVTQIYNYYKKHGFKTEVMGASFRTAEQVLALCGCDLLTISPKLLEELGDSDTQVTPSLNASEAAEMDIERLAIDEKSFRWMLNQDAMATEKLSEGIRSFAGDLDKLRSYLAQRMETVAG